VGEFAIGTNVGLTEPTGNLLQDEKMPGLHVAFGDPYGHFTGADWSSDIHVDVIPFAVDVDVDGEALVRDGAFVASRMR
jgi:aminopeptidase